MEDASPQMPPPPSLWPSASSLTSKGHTDKGNGGLVVTITDIHITYFCEICNLRCPLSRSFAFNKSSVRPQAGVILKRSRGGFIREGAYSRVGLVIKRN